MDPRMREDDRGGKGHSQIEEKMDPRSSRG
jgi:hypothetical protein